MPGLSQLKKFNSDILALGKEAELRASRGEKTSVILIPKTIEDADDSDDFVLGMPEVAEDLSSAEDEEAPDDFSDITGRGKSSLQEGNASADSQKAEVPDVAELLNPVDMNDSGSGSSDVPDLSQFMEPPQESEPEPEPPSIADLSLDDLLSSSGFDDTTAEEEPPAAVENEKEPVPPESGFAPQKDEPVESSSFFTEPDVSADAFNETETLESAEKKSESASLEDIEPEEPADTTPEEIPADEFQGEKKRASGDDFDYAGQTLDMNTGLPDEVNETDAGKAAHKPEEPEPVEPLADDFGIESVPEPEKEFSAEGEGSEQGMPAEEKFNLPDFDEDAVKGASPVEESVPSAVSGDLNLPDMGMEEFNPDTFDFNLADTDIGKNSVAGKTPSEENAPPEKFDTSDIAGLDFSIKDTDTKLADDEKSDFELGKGSDFKEENADFEIPGFSDTDTIKEDKNGRIKLPIPDFTGAAEGDRPGKNTLTDKQYKQFLSNLSDYPLNVRIAVENLLVNNEFTDDAQFEVIAKVLNKTPARQVASHLEKMLDISIPVPRDFERRTATEYEVYKSSLQYQLRNRIIPGLVFGMLALLLVFGLFQAGKNFIYKPLKAGRLYKEGYALLKSDEYPQSEMKFNDAVKYELQKKWFYRYARGYRSHKQYQRAEKMYRNILYCFNHDKPAGIEYAQMECEDLENYEKAEEIAKREVLDYHINDPDGILLLGDIYLEWGTEKDPLKLEDARKQYSSLVQLYGQTNLYMSRMMRYFIRTDNLREVLQLKDRFYPKEKSLNAQDWTELSGYLLDKLYGQLAPADEYLRTHIEDVKEMLVRAVEADPSNPVAYYNLSHYFVQMNNGSSAIQTLEQTIDTFKKAPSLHRRETYKEIDSYRLLGEQYAKQKEYLKAQEKYTDGITLFTDEHDSSGLEGNGQIGRLYADAGDIDYFIHGNLDSAYDEYTTAVDTDYATPSLFYRIGYIDYGRGDYDKAVGSFIKVGADNPLDNHLLLAMGNTLSLCNDNYAAQGYYERLISNLDAERDQKGLLLPQVRADQAELVDLYLKASNNLGVTLYRLARRTGNSSLNAESMVQLTTSMRAWDAMTRNQTTMVRLGGSNLAEQNMKYMSHSIPEYEPAIYTDIPRILGGEGELSE